MNYSSLVGDKNTAGSIARWVNYSKLDGDVVLAEAQAILYSLLRVREMRTHMSFTVTPGGAHVPVPASFLDPIGKVHLLDRGAKAEQRAQNDLQSRLVYQQFSGTLPNNPFTTTAGVVSVIVNLPGHGFSAGGTFYTSGAAAFNGVVVAGTFDIVGIVDTNNFSIDITPLGATPSASGAGGGSAAAYTANVVPQGTPMYFGIWDEAIWFDVPFSQQCSCILHHFRALPPLSPSNPANFLTNRYPHLLRKACVLQAWDFLRNETEYAKAKADLEESVALVNAEADLLYRSAVISDQ